MGKQWILGVALGLGLTAGAIGTRTAFQQRQLERTHQNEAARTAVEASVGAASKNTTESTESDRATDPNQSGRPSLFGQFTQAENDYLYDLSQALQPNEKAKMDAAARLEIGRTVAGWAEAGAGYWELRQKFDATYAAAPSDREVYLKYAIQRFAPAHTAALIEPPPRPIAAPTRSEPISRPEYIPAPIPRPPDRPISESPIPDKPIPGRPEVIPSPGKPPDDSAPGGSLIVAPEPPPEMITPEEPEATPEPIPAPDPAPMPDPIPPPVPEPPPVEAAPLPIRSEPEQG